ncbi:MAG: helix-turn-helix transcriptional regulator [Acidimicrobiia bacterium]|nr:helix-turn-helix transcriptional regulator [Acidimicrobiia bacterium]MBA3982712.1 helix-turn-helix transcriptional regulator [Acidimicrobiia bacterium]MDQ3391319.1 helix-turn-helix transcriptional regulator [Actinomycetota bacterium]
MYRERPSRLPGGFVWTSTVADGSSRILPDGCIDLIWNDGDLFVAGPDTEAQLFSGVPGSSLAGLRFAPGFGPKVVGVPAHALVNSRIPLDALWTSVAVRCAVDRLQASDEPGEVLEDLALERRVEEDDRLDLVAHVAELARRGAPVSSIADAVGLSGRQLQRRCVDAFGYGAKTLARILRMNRAVELARSGVPFADVAVRSGYADQSHLARDVRELAGVPLGQLTS